MRRTKDRKLHLCRFVGHNMKEQKIHIIKKTEIEQIPNRLYDISLCGYTKTSRDYLLQPGKLNELILYTDLCLNCVARLIHDETHSWKRQLDNYSDMTIEIVETILSNVKLAKRIIKGERTKYSNAIEKHKKEIETLIKEYNRHSTYLRKRLDLSMYRLTEKALNHNSESVRRVMIQNIHDSFMFFDGTHVYETLDLTMRILRKG